MRERKGITQRGQTVGPWLFLRAETVWERMVWLRKPHKALAKRFWYNSPGIAQESTLPAHMLLRFPPVPKEGENEGMKTFEKKNTSTQRHWVRPKLVIINYF